jgi:hypothetical protein
LKRTVGQSPPATIYKRGRSNKLKKFNRGRERLTSIYGEREPTEQTIQGEGRALHRK